jgi:raffinose/stachyose/melibiose transport system permease protein
LNNFTEMIRDKMILRTFANTAMYSFFITFFQNILGLLVAVFMVKKFKGVNVLRMVFFMPAIFSPLLIGFIWGFILEPNIGVINNLLNSLGLEQLRQPWLSDPSLARWMIIYITIWQFLGYSMVIYIAGLKGIDNSYYEAARVDGANAFEQFFHITLPMIAPAITINIILSSIGTLKIFAQVYALTGGGPGYSTQSLATMIYELGFKTVRWGYGSAMSLIMFLVIFALTIMQITVLRKREVDL